ncbi:MAG: hypothetical protein IPP14_13450 [Planctomycetes bacterium]|nr:hypothetical protein [Planctomycetota bacterium]
MKLDPGPVNRVATGPQRVICFCGKLLEIAHPQRQQLAQVDQQFGLLLHQ